eukprot:TRINITY_DN3205_c0_g2_i7.p2 TRINITY_DN3205_c0_g2~~TRINITY_DN3205_c0_g2_i7.p2  ORF type:complete len:119 (-),score=17.08 TRINITY_DN3205_c0_g2_i7:546-902(-)
MRFGRKFVDQPDEESFLLEMYSGSDEENVRKKNKWKVRKGGREGKSQCYRVSSHKSVVTLVLTTLHLFFFVPAVGSLVYGPRSYEFGVFDRGLCFSGRGVTMINNLVPIFYEPPHHSL